MMHWKETFRQKLAAGGRRLFSVPYLPPGLVWSTLLVALTDLGVILLAQPAGYWITSTRAESGLPFLEKLLASGLGWYVLVSFLYLGLLGLCLTLLTRSVALVVWLMANFVHLAHSLVWLGSKVLTEDPLNNSLSLILITELTGLVLGIVLVALLMRPKSVSEPKRLASYLQKGLPTVWIVFLVGMVVFRAVLPKSGWQQIKPEHSPGKRAYSAVAYDPIRQRAVLFGGIGIWLGWEFMVDSETWEWDGADWYEMKPEQSPSPREGASMAFDEEREEMVLFGGQHVRSDFMHDDTWIWDGNEWELIYPQNVPPQRRGAQMIIDEKNGKVLLSGGYRWDYDNDGEKNRYYYSDTWAWDGTNWQLLSPDGHQFGVTTPSVVYDPILERSVVLDINDVVTWSGYDWQKMDTTGMPLSRFNTSPAIDPDTGNILLFGGLAKDEYLNDTWMLNGDTWQELTPDLEPSPRDAYIMFYDSVRKSFVLYGGAHYYVLDDMWEFVVP